MKRIAIFALLAVSASAFSDPIMISQGGASFGWTDDAALSGAAVRTGTGGGAGNVFQNTGPDHSFQHWWWYRANGVNAREFALSNMSSAPIVGSNFMELNYREVEGFTARLEYTVTEPSAGISLVTATARVRNEGNSALDLSFFQYVDFDVAATTGNIGIINSANPAFMATITDNANTNYVQWRGIDADDYQVGAFSSVRTLFTDADVDDLNSTGLPFSGDFTGAIQWNFMLNPGEQILLQTSFEAGPVPEPATMLVLASASAAFIARRRRNRK